MTLLTDHIMLLLTSGGGAATEGVICSLGPSLSPSLNPAGKHDHMTHQPHPLCINLLQQMMTRPLMEPYHLLLFRNYGNQRV